MKLYLLVFLLLFNRANAQELVPAQVIQNGSFTIGDLWLLDPDSLKGNYPVGKITTVLNVAANSVIGIQVDEKKLREDQEFIAIYDGPSVNSPLLTKLTRSSGDAGVKSSGPVVTIVFYAISSYNTLKNGWRLRIRSLQPTVNDPDFSSIFRGGRKGNIQLADYDKDGDKDVLIGGEIYRNDSKYDSLYVFDRIKKPLANWRTSNMAAADFDGDGFKDVFIVGNQLNYSSVFKAVIFKNNNGSFSETAAPFPFLNSSSISTLDFNNDGKTDIAYTGESNGVYLFKLYLNQGNFNFIEITTNLPGLANASMSWLDYDKDGDLDLVMNGLNGTSQPMRLFINNNDNSFTDAKLITSYSSSGTVHWADIDGDGNSDIVNSGNSIPEILFNNGNGTFTRTPTNLPNFSSSNHDWADYDQDGDLDMLVSGGEYGNGDIKQYAAIFKNNGNAHFSKVSIGDPTSISSVKWVDFNRDGKWDAFVSGRRFTPGAFYKNMGSDSFQVSSYPFTAYQIKGVALAEDFTNDGYIDVLFAGQINEDNCEPEYSSTLIKSLGWRLFPIAKLTKVADLNPFPGSSTPYWRWGDVDSDGKLDVLLSHDPNVGVLLSQPLKIFKNNGNDSFTVMFNDFVGINSFQDQAGVVDIDNDGVNELFMVPNNLYRWNGSGFTTLYEDESFNVAGDVNHYSYFDFGDYDQDGFIDVAISQHLSFSILKNNGEGRFVRIMEGGNGPNRKFLKWADFDNDGDLDLLTSNFVYENTSYGGFRLRDANTIRDDGLTYWNGHSGIGDFNRDGFADLFTISYNNSMKPASLLYNQQGKLFFENKPPADFFKYSGDHQGAEAFDIDNDGDDDIICSAGDGCTYSCIYINNSNIRNSFIFLRTQNSGGDYVIGTSYPISWTGNLMSNAVSIELSVDSGSTWSQIVDDVPNTSDGGNFNWQIENVQPSRTALIRIKDINNNTLSDLSDKVFTILPRPLTGIVNSPQKVCADSSFTVIFIASNVVPVGAGLQLWESINGTKATEMGSNTYNGSPVKFIIDNNHEVENKTYFVQITYPAATGFNLPYYSDSATTKVIRHIPPVIAVNNNTCFVLNIDSAANYRWQSLLNNTWSIVSPGVLSSSYAANKTGIYRAQLVKGGCAEFSNSIAVTIDTTEENPSNIYLYPNPATNILTIDSLSGDWVILDIITADGGQKVASYSITNQSKFTINIEGIRTGIYLAVLKDINGRSVSIRFIKI